MKPALQKRLLAVFIFIAAVAVRWPLVDRYYENCFQPDSEACVDISRSFYFFFKNPRIENAPQTLSGYPTYRSGPFICAAITANLVRPLAQHGIITANLCDADRSLFIFSMRWNSVLFDALAAVVLFYILTLIAGNSLLSAVIVLLYFLFTHRIMEIRLLRVDHYMLFAAYLTFYFSLKIYKQPENAWNFIGAGFAAALVSASKFNFPFYLPAFILALGGLIYSGKLSLRSFLLMAFAFTFTVSFFYMRWFMYPENIRDTLNEIIGTGREWTSFWGFKPYFFYHWHQFFQSSSQLGTRLLILLWYASLLICFYRMVRRREFFLFILCCTFILQSALLVISPKVDRYGMIMPLWICIFFALALQTLAPDRMRNWKVALLGALLLLPRFAGAMIYYGKEIEEARVRSISTAETRLAAANWLRANAPPDARILLYHPRVSNPPVFEMPWLIEQIRYPFLNEKELLAFKPPGIQDIAMQFNFFVVSDKEKDFHLDVLQATEQKSGIDSLLRISIQWKKFYDSLNIIFPRKTFTGKAENYQVKRFDIYILNKDTFPALPVIQHLANGYSGNNFMELSWEAQGENLRNFEVQVSEDSSFRWLLHGSYDGFPCKFRKVNYALNCIPDKIALAIRSGEFEKITGMRLNEQMVDVNSFFRNVLVKMQNDSVDFGTCLNELVPVDHEREPLLIGFTAILSREIASCALEEFLRVCNLPEKIVEQVQVSRYTVSLHLSMDGRPALFWRVRAKQQEWVRSAWSKTAVIYNSAEQEFAQTKN